MIKHKKLITYLLTVSVALNMILIASSNRQATEAGATVITKKVFVPEIVYKDTPQSKPHYEVTNTERELLARVVYQEAGIESLECQKAVVSVIFNRIKSGIWGGTINDVVYADSQFTVAPLLCETTPDEECYTAVDYVLKNGGTLPEYVLFFRAGYHFKWAGYVGYKTIDNTYFGYLEKDLQSSG